MEILTAGSMTCYRPVNGWQPVLRGSPHRPDTAPAGTYGTPPMFPPTYGAPASTGYSQGTIIGASLQQLLPYILIGGVAWFLLKGKMRYPIGLGFAPLLVAAPAAGPAAPFVVAAALLPLAFKPIMGLFTKDECKIEYDAERQKFWDYEARLLNVDTVNSWEA